MKNNKMIVNIELTPETAYILRLVAQFTINQCEQEKARDPLKDNDYIINACAEYLEKSK